MYIIGKQTELVNGLAFTLAENPYVHRMKQAAEEEYRRLARTHQSNFAVFKRVSVAECVVDVQNVLTNTDVLTEQLTEGLIYALQSGQVKGKADLRALVSKCLNRSLLNKVDTKPD